MNGLIPLDECKKLHPEQWVKVYGVFCDRCDYINTCQVDQLETVLSGNRKSWWDGFFLELVDEEAQPISVEQVFVKGHHCSEGNISNPQELEAPSHQRLR
jgi:hypothetical protein